MGRENPITLLQFLGACFYSAPVEYYNQLPDTERVILEQQGKYYGLTAWFYRYLYNVLPDQKQKEYQKDYQACSAQALITGLELKRFCNVLSEREIRFTPIKGADLAYRLYPDPALRRFNDFDIWIHPDDCERGLDALDADGWDAPVRYGNSPLRKDPQEHHFYPHRRNGFILEPHYTLANFEGISAYDLWNYTIELKPSSGQYILSPEMNLLMLTRHAASKSYFHAQIPKLLTDSAIVLQKETVDFSKLHAMAEKWKLPYPGNLLAAFPMFFPEEAIASWEIDSTETEKFRNLFEKRAQLNVQNNATITFSYLKAHKNVFGGVFHVICSLDASMMRAIYHLPKEKAWGQVIWAFIIYFFTRGVRLMKAAFRDDQEMQEYNAIIKEIENNCQ